MLGRGQPNIHCSQCYASWPRQPDPTIPCSKLMVSVLAYQAVNSGIQEFVYQAVNSGIQEFVFSRGIVLPSRYVSPCALTSLPGTAVRSHDPMQQIPGFCPCIPCSKFRNSGIRLQRGIALPSRGTCFHLLRPVSQRVEQQVLSGMSMSLVACCRSEVLASS